MLLVHVVTPNQFLESKSNNLRSANMFETVELYSASSAITIQTFVKLKHFSLIIITALTLVKNICSKT